MHTENFITPVHTPVHTPLQPPNSAASHRNNAEYHQGSSKPFYLQQANVLGLNIAPLSAQQLCGAVGQFIETGQKKKVFYVNAHGVNLCFRYRWLSRIMQKADLLFCDGNGLRLGAALTGAYIPERITLADWIWQFAAYAEPRNYSMFFLGCKPEVAEQAIAVLKERYPKLRVVGSHHGYFDKERHSAQNQRIVQMINHAKPDMLFTGFGMPLQEKWLHDNWPDLDVKVGITSGAMLDYIAGTTRRSPRWMNENNLEWLGRLLIEPRRLWKRYVLGNPLFVLRILLRRSLV